MTATTATTAGDTAGTVTTAGDTVAPAAPVNYGAGTVAAPELAAAVKLALIGAPARATWKGAGVVRLTADGSTLTVESFDWETAVRVPVSYTGEHFDTVAVDARELAAAIKGNKGAVTVAAGPDGVTVGAVTLPYGIPAGDLPALPVMPAHGATLTDSGDIAGVLPAILPAAGRDDTLPTLTGVHFEWSDGAFRLAATDRYRLHFYSRDAYTGTAAPADALVPARTLAAALTAAGRGATLSVGTYETAGTRYALVKLASTALPAGAILASRTLDGAFPKYRALIPTECASVWELPAGELAAALEVMRKHAHKNTPAVLELAGDTVTVRTNNESDGPVARVSVPVTVTGDGPESIGYNPAYLLAAVQSVAGKRPAAGESVRIKLTTATRPALLAGTVPVSALVMPVRLFAGGE